MNKEKLTYQLTREECEFIKAALFADYAGVAIRNPHLISAKSFLGVYSLAEALENYLSETAESEFIGNYFNSLQLRAFTMALDQSFKLIKYSNAPEELVFAAFGVTENLKNKLVHLGEVTTF